MEEPAHGPGPPAPAVTAGPYGDDNDGELDRLRRRYPRWRIWRGRATGDYWAMPPRDHPTERGLICASGIDDLADRLARAEGWRDR